MRFPIKIYPRKNVRLRENLPSRWNTRSLRMMPTDCLSPLRVRRASAPRWLAGIVAFLMALQALLPVAAMAQTPSSHALTLKVPGKLSRAATLAATPFRPHLPAQFTTPKLARPMTYADVRSNWQDALRQSHHAPKHQPSQKSQSGQTGALPPPQTAALPRSASAVSVPVNTGGVFPAATPDTLLDEVGLLARPVPPTEVAAWRGALHTAGGTNLAQTHLWLGEYELAHDQQPLQAAHQFRLALGQSRRADRLHGLAAYDSAISLFYEGAYQEATDAFQKLLSPKTALAGYDRRSCALWLRHAAACAGYHAERADQGIPEPPRLDPLCGAAALAACLRALHLPYDSKTVLASCRVTGEGSTLQDVLNAGIRLGVTTRSVTADDRGLMLLPKPLVAYVEHDHFIAVTRADKKGVTYLCSDCGPWPGGEVRLTWKQWHALEPGLYATVLRPGTVWAQAVDTISSDGIASPHRVTAPAVRVASLGGMVAMPRSAAYRSLLNLAHPHVFRPIPTSGPVQCGSKPTSKRCPSLIVCPLDTPDEGSGPQKCDPVNLATGEEEYTPGADLAVYNPHGPSVGLSRIYSSLRQVGQGYYGGDATYQANDFGTGWSQSYNVSVYDPTNGAAGSDSNGHPYLKYLIEPNGARISFSAPTTPAAGSPVRCAVQAGAALLVEWDYDATDAGGHYTITGPDRSKMVTTTVNPATGCYSLAQIIDRNGNAINFTYTAAPDGFAWPLLSAIVDASTGTPLLTVQRATDGSGNIVSLTDIYGRSVYYHVGYYQNVNIPALWPQTYQLLDGVSQIVPTGTPNPPSRYAFGYQLLSNTEAQEQVRFLHAITVPSPSGTGTSTALINYDPATDFVASLVDANGNVRSYQGVDASGNPANPSNFTKVTVRDAGGNVAYTHVAGYDGNMNQTGETDGAGHPVSVPSYSDPNNPFRPSSVTDGNGKSVAYTWDSFGNVLTLTSPRGVTLTNTWDYSQFALGELTQSQAASLMNTLAPTTYEYFEPSGLPKAIHAPRPGTVGAGAQVTASFTYDSLGNPLTVTAPGNNAAGQITTTFGYTTDPGDVAHGIAGYSQSEALGQPLTVTDNLGKSGHLRYDTLGNLVTAYDALGNETDTVYNVAEQPLSTSLPPTGQTGPGRSGASFSYLYPAGPVLTASALDESQTVIRQVTSHYGSEGETLSVTGSTEPVAYTYDALYRLKTLADGNGNPTQYAYNAAGYPALITYPGGDTVQFSLYDGDGNLLKQIDGRGVETDFVYNDVETALTDVQYPAASGLNIHYRYDDFGRVAARSDSSGAYSYGYDDLGGLTDVETAYTGVPVKSLRYAFYPNGSRQSMTTPAGSFSYSYDGNGRPNGLLNPYGETSAWQYLDNGWLWKQQLGNGAITTYAYNALGQRTDQATTTGGTLLSEFSGQVYDGAGNRTSLTATTPAMAVFNGATSFQYDGKDQLTQEQSTRNSGYANTFAYDNNAVPGAGNATSFRGASLGYNANNQITNGGFAYDGAGNPTTYAGASFTFDAAGHLTSLGSLLTAGYTGGYRAWKGDGTGNNRTYFLYDGSDPVCEMNGSGSLKAVNTFGANGLLSRKAITGASDLFYTFDPQGSVAQRLDGSGTPASTSLYDAYGAQAGHLTVTNGDPFGFGGQYGYYTDSETGLNLLGHRYYDPSTGRFITRDPIGYSGGVNLYGYTANNPVNGSDPSGFTPGGDGLNDERDANPLNLLDPFSAYGMSNDAWIRAGDGSGTIPAALATTALSGLSIYGWGKSLVQGAVGLARAGLSAMAKGSAGKASNAALHQLYLKGLRRQMEKPCVHNQQLSGLLDDLYRPGAKIGSGSTAAAIREELATGGTVGGKTHSIKGVEYVSALEKWLGNNQSASPGDRAAAENVIKDLRDALGH